MATPNEIMQIKDFIIKMPVVDISVDFLQKYFAKSYDKGLKKELPAMFNFTDPVKLRANELLKNTACTTTLGRVIFNKVILSEFPNVFTYLNVPVTEKQLGALEEVISDAFLEDKINFDQIADYFNRIQFLGLAPHSFICGSFTPNTVTPLPGVMALRKKLLAQYKEELAGPESTVYALKIEKALKEEARKELKNDPGMDLYDSGARGSFDNNYKNMMIMRGPVWNPLTQKFDVLDTSLMEGISKEQIPSYGTQVTSGAYPKAKGTRDAGYMGKKLMASMQSSVVDEKGSDCGSKRYRVMLLTQKNFADVKYRYFLSGNSLKLLTPEIGKQYYGKIIKLRSPLYCRSSHLCNKCIGELPYLLGIKNVGITTSAISSSYLNTLMKSFHDATVHSTKIDIKTMIL